jgi:hypothetical protein
MTDYSEVLEELKYWYLSGPREWLRIWNGLPPNVRDIVTETFGLRPKFHKAKSYLSQLPISIPAFQLAAYCDFVVRVVLNVNAYGYAGSVPHVQSDLDAFASSGLDRAALIGLGKLEGIFNLV